MQTFSLVLSCEHATDALPPDLSGKLVIDPERARSHRGWDPGALEVARALAGLTGAPLVAGVVNRLVVDLNRTRGAARFSYESRQLPAALRQHLLERYWEPHVAALTALIRERLMSESSDGAFAMVDAAVDLDSSPARGQVAVSSRETTPRAVQTAAKRGPGGSGMPVLHLAIHSFTPNLNGEKRRADVALLYDPRRSPEAELCRRWAETLAMQSPLRIRRNYPYRGVSDGLPTYFRRHFAEASYIGIEVELNQALFRAGNASASTGEALAKFLLDSLIA